MCDEITDDVEILFGAEEWDARRILEKCPAKDRPLEYLKLMELEGRDGQLRQCLDVPDKILSTFARQTDDEMRPHGQSTSGGLLDRPYTGGIVMPPIDGIKCPV